MIGSGSWLDWAVFAGSACATQALLSLLFGKQSERVSFREAAVRSSIWILSAFGFGLYVWVRLGKGIAIPYVTAYLVEESLSVDNLFVFLAVFAYFKVQEREQLRVLTWGILGAVVMRMVFILLGATLLQKVHWMIYVFGAFLIFTGGKLIFQKEKTIDPEDSIALRIARKSLHTTAQFEGDRFFTRVQGKLFATPLLLVLIVVEFSDILFAVDSVPAVLAISDDLFIVYTSNVYAILGLRALYFALAGMMTRFRFLDVGVSAILIFIGAKMVGSVFYKLPDAASLAVIGGLLLTAIVSSQLFPARKDAGAP